jgi:hypothetical protein
MLKRQDGVVCRFLWSGLFLQFRRCWDDPAAWTLGREGSANSTLPHEYFFSLEWPAYFPFLI